MSVNSATGVNNQSLPQPEMSQPEAQQTPLSGPDGTHVSPQDKLEADLKGNNQNGGSGQVAKAKKDDPASQLKDVRADNKGTADAAKDKQESDKADANKKTAESGVKAGQTTQAVGGGLMAAGAVAACFPPVGTIVGAVLAVVGALVSFFGGQSAKNAQEQAQQVQTAEATQKAQSDKVANHQRDTEITKIGSSKSSKGQLLADSTKDTAKESGVKDVGQAKPSPAASATIAASKQ